MFDWVVTISVICTDSWGLRPSDRTTMLQFSPSMYTTQSAKPLDLIRLSILLSCSTAWAMAAAFSAAAS